MLDALDRGLLRLMRTRLHGSVPEKAMKALGSAGENGAVWFLGGMAAAALDRRGRRGAWAKAAALAPAAIVGNYAIKRVVGRPRPVLEGLPPLGGAPSSLSFPSAHSTSSFAAAVAMSRLAPDARTPLLALAAAIAIGRPYLGMHYPSDVLAGAALGAAVGQLVPLGERDSSLARSEKRLLDLAAANGERAEAPVPA